MQNGCQWRPTRAVSSDTRPAAARVGSTEAALHNRRRWNSPADTICCATSHSNGVCAEKEQLGASCSSRASRKSPPRTGRLDRSWFLLTVAQSWQTLGLLMIQVLGSRHGASRANIGFRATARRHSCCIILEGQYSEHVVGVTNLTQKWLSSSRDQLQHLCITEREVSPRWAGTCGVFGLLSTTLDLPNAGIGT